MINNPAIASKRVLVAKIAKSHQSRRTGDDDSGVAETDNRDEESDAGSDSGVKLLRNRFEDQLTDAKTVRMRNATPDKKTAPRAVSHGTPMPLTTV